MDTDRNLLFAVLALQADLLDNDRFAEACSAWAARKNTPLADLLVEHGWLNEEERGHVEFLLDRKLRKHEGDAHASLAEASSDAVKRSLAGLTDPNIRQTVASLTTPPAGVVMVSTTASEPASRDRYTLSRLHATGGIGRVWLARDQCLGREVALKELRPDRAGYPTVWARFLKEARVTGQLEHPGIVPIYELGRRPEDQQPFYTMRFVRGRTLGEAARAYHDRRSRAEAGPLELREMLTAFMGVCNAAAYAHSRGVLHRDLKPQNVVLGDFGEVVVLDWGLARLTDQMDDDMSPLEVATDGQTDETAQGQVLGTPAYMAPEQAEGRLDLLSPAADVYGLGAILYEVLTGRPPFSGPETTAVLRQVIHEAPARPRRLVADVPAALEAVCLKALAKRPAERYASGRELGQELQHWLADEPVRAYPEPWAARLGRWGRRHRPVVATAAAVLVTTVVALGVGIVRVERERTETERERQQAVAARNEASRNADLAQAAEKQAQVNAAIAAEQRQLALGGLHVLVTAVQEQLADQPGTQPLKRELLTTALAGLEQVAQSADRSPVIDLRMAQAHVEMGAIFLAAGELEQAGRQFEKGRDIAGKLVEDDGSLAEARLELAIAYRQLGTVKYRSGQTADARQLYEQSRDTLKNLLSENDADRKSRQELVLTQDELGEAILQLGNTPAAREAYQEGAEQARKLFEADREDSQARASLAELLAGLAHTHLQLGDATQGEKLAAESLGLLVPVEKQHAKKIAVRRALAASYVALGQAQQTTGKTREARQSYEAALKQAEALAAADDDVTARRNLSVALNRLGDIGLYNGQSKQARDYLVRSVQVMEGVHTLDPHSARVQEDLALASLRLARAQFNLGEAGEALTRARAARDLFVGLIRLDDRNTEFRRSLLSAWLLLAQVQVRQGNPVEAAPALEKAIELGEQLVKQDEKNATLRQDLYVSLNNLGDLYLARGDFVKARDLFERAHVHTRFAAERDRKNLELQRDLGLVQGRLSDALRGLRDVAGAVRLQEQAGEQLRALVRADPENLEFQRDLASTLLRLGMLYEDRQEVARAEPLYREGAATFEKLVNADSNNTRYRQDLLVLCNRVADLRLLKLNDRETSRRFYDRAMEQARWRCDKDPADAEARADLVLQHLRDGRHALLDGRHQKALAGFEKVLDLLARMDKDGVLKDAPAYVPRPPFVKDMVDRTRKAIQAAGDLDYATKQGPALTQYLLFQRVLFLCNEGKAEAAVATLEKLHQAGPQTISIQFDVARGYGRCASVVLRGRKPEALNEAEKSTLSKYRTKALEAAERCVDLGFKDLLRLEVDSDLAPLRQEEAYRKLAERLKRRE
jgi:serine/threonine-protein kinase